MCSRFTRSDLQLLLWAGVPQQRIAELTGVSVRAISRIRQERFRPPEAPKPFAARRPRTLGQDRNAVASMMRVSASSRA